MHLSHRLAPFLSFFLSFFLSNQLDYVREVHIVSPAFFAARLEPENRVERAPGAPLRKPPSS